jgi:hypothetical protein
MPTHTYLGATDSKLVDAQAGLESGMGAMIGALSGINMISGSGMLDSLLCHSAEKLVIDAEGIAMAKRMLQGIKIHTETLATGFYDQASTSRAAISSSKGSPCSFSKRNSTCPARSSTAIPCAAGRNPADWTPSDAPDNA